MELIIKKQRLEVECTHENNAWRHTDQVTQMLEKTMMPLLEKNYNNSIFKDKHFI